MKRFLLFVLMSFMSAGVYAQNNSIYIAVEGGTYTYREPHMEDPIHNYGNKIGASFEWVGKRILESSGLMDEGDKSFATFELRYITGETSYRGYTWGGTPLSINNVPDWYVEGRITFGETYDLGKNFELWPYIGIGYRRLENDMAKVYFGGYKRISEYWYIPVGFKFNKNFNSGLTISLTGEFDWLMEGRQRSDLADVYEIDSDWIYNVQPEGWGIRFGLKVEAPINKKFGIFVEPYYRMWKIQNSNLGTSEDFAVVGNTHYYWIVPVIEPFNITKEAGIRAGIYF